MDFKNLRLLETSNGCFESIKPYLTYSYAAQ